METKTIKKAVSFNINNQTSILVKKCFYLEIEMQDHYKNGKPKGKAYYNSDYYFFDNDSNIDKFINKYKDLPFFENNCYLVVKDGTRYNSKFLQDNLNKI